MFPLFWCSIVVQKAECYGRCWVLSPEASRTMVVPATGVAYHPLHLGCLRLERGDGRCGSVLNTQQQKCDHKVEKGGERRGGVIS